MKHVLSGQLLENLPPSEDGEAMPEMVGIDRACWTYPEPSNLLEPAEWFAASTLPRHEKAVAHHLSEHCIDSFLPLYSKDQKWKKSRAVILNLPLFPGYIFVHICRSKRASVLRVPGVCSIVGSTREPWPLKDAEIEALREAVSTGRVWPHAYLSVGERVRVIRGVMTGFEGILVRVKNNLRVVVSLDAIMRSVAVEVAGADVEPVPTCRSAEN
jgi:transcription antitermination factor NusG